MVNKLLGALIGTNGEYTKFFRTQVDGIKVLISFGWTFELGYFISVDNHSTYRMSQEDWYARLEKLGYQDDNSL